MSLIDVRISLIIRTFQKKIQEIVFRKINQSSFRLMEKNIPSNTDDAGGAINLKECGVIVSVVRMRDLQSCQTTPFITCLSLGTRTFPPNKQVYVS